jgi:hypothetical protein
VSHRLSFTLTAVVRSEEPLSALRDDFQRSLSIPPDEHDSRTENPDGEEHDPQTDSPEPDHSRPIDSYINPVKQDRFDAGAVPVQTDEPKEQSSSDPLDEDDTLVESENDDDEDIDNGIKGVYYEAEDGELTPVVW